MIYGDEFSELATENNKRSGGGVSCGAVDVNQSVEVVLYADNEVVSITFRASINTDQ